MAAPEAELKEACAAMGDLVCGPVPDGKLLPLDIYKAIANGGTGKIQFIKAQPMELYADELHGLPALKWKLCDRKFGTYLYVGEKDVFCMPFHRPLQGMFDEL